MTIQNISLISFAAALFVFGLVSLNTSDIVAQQTVAYTSANIETMGPDGRIEDATLLVANGKIVAVGQDVKIPATATRVSLANKTILPALVDPYFVFGRTPPPQTPASELTRGRRFRGFSQQRFTVGPFIKVAEFFYPYETDFMPAIRTGVTTANLVSDGRGFSALARLDAEPTENMLMDVDGFLFAKVTNQTSALDTIRNGLDPESASRNRRGARSRFGGRRTGGRRDGPPPNENSSENEDEKESETTQDNDETKPLWTAVREGKKPLIVNANNAATVAHLLKVLAKYDKVKLYLVATGANLYQSLDEIKNSNVTVVLQPGIEQVPYTTQRMNVSKMIADREIPFALSMSLDESQMKAMQHDPLFPVSALVKTGLPRTVALTALTIKPAQMLGIDKTHGSLEPGKSADFLVFGGDPMTTDGQLQKVFSKGRLIHEN